MQHINQDCSTDCPKVFRAGCFIAAVAAATLTSGALAGVVDAPGGFVLRSNSGIALDGSVNAGGSVGALGSVTMGYGSSATGLVEQGSTRTWLNPSLNDFAAPGGSAVNLGWSATQALSAGNYGALTSNSSVTVNLGAGSYSFTSFQLGWNGVVNADTSGGDVYMYVSGGLTAADSTRFQTTGPGRLIIVTGGNSSFGYGTNITASIYSGGTLGFGGATQFSGTAFSTGNMSAGYGSTFAYVVPGPGAMALLPVAAGVAFGRGRRRK